MTISKSPEGNLKDKYKNLSIKDYSRAFCWNLVNTEKDKDSILCSRSDLFDIVGAQNIFCVCLNQNVLQSVLIIIKYFTFILSVNIGQCV